MFIASALMFVFLQYELPTFPLRGWLSGEIPSSAPTVGGDTFINRRVVDLSKLLLASKLQQPQDRSESTLLYGYPLDREQAVAIIETHYSIAILICAAGWLYFLFTSRPAISTRAEILIDHSRVVAFGLLIIVTCLVPYEYGKLIDSTTLPDAAVAYREFDPAINKDTTQYLEGGLLAHTDKTITILWTGQEGLSKVVELPLDHVIYLHYWKTTDPVGALVHSPAPPPVLLPVK